MEKENRRERKEEIGKKSFIQKQNSEKPSLPRHPGRNHLHQNGRMFLTNAAIHGGALGRMPTPAGLQPGTNGLKPFVGVRESGGCTTLKGRDSWKRLSKTPLNSRVFKSQTPSAKTQTNPIFQCSNNQRENRKRKKN